MTETQPASICPKGQPRSFSAASPAKTEILTRLRRLEGQLRGIQRMIDDDETCCVDVLTQLAAVVSAARATGLLVLEGHIRDCIAGAAPEQRAAVVDEFTDAIAHFTRVAG